MRSSLADLQFALVILLPLLDVQLCLASPRKAVHAPRYIATHSGNFSGTSVGPLGISTSASTSASTTANTTSTTTSVQSTTTLLFNSTTTTEASRQANPSSTSTIATTSILKNHDAWGDWVNSSPTSNHHPSGEDGPSARGGGWRPDRGDNSGASGGGWRPHQGDNLGASGTDNSRPGDTPPQPGGNGQHGWTGSSWGGYQNSTTGDNTTSDGNWYGENDGVPALTEEDILFIISERALAYAGFPDSDGSTWPINDSVVITKRQTTGDFDPSKFGGPNTLQKWNDLAMDEWLELYVAKVDIPGQPGKKLANSTNFFRDFWLSTGEENIVLCTSLLSECNVADISDEKRFKNISREDAYRAQFVRQVMKVWQSSNSQAYRILYDTVTSDQLKVTTSHNVLVQGTPPPSTNIFDVIVPAIAFLGAFVPVLAPVAGLVSGIYAVGKAVTKRENVVENVIWEEPRMNSSDAFETLQKRDDEQTAAISDLLDRVHKLENKPPKTWLDQAKDPQQIGKGLEAAAKIYLAIKGLNPSLPSSSISSWDFFDQKVLETLQVFPKNILTAFELNVKTYWPQQTTKKDGTTILSSGMRPFLLGGTWSLAEAHTEEPSATMAKVKKYLDAVIFMQYVQQQAFYYWVQNFPSASACTAARDDAVDRNWLAKDGWYNCEQLATGQYQLQYTRKPTTNRGRADANTYTEYDPFGDIVALEPAPEFRAGFCWVQQRSGNAFRDNGFQQNTAGLNKWNDGILGELLYDFKMSDVFGASRACQAAMGDPFTQNKSPRNAFYPSLRVEENPPSDGGDGEILSGKLPLCLFNLPIFEVGRSDLDAWCNNHIGSISRDRWTKDDDSCGEKLELWAIQSDTKLCGSNQGSYYPKRSSRPGCSLHERGVNIASCKDYQDI
ncbi:hypothetical protein LTS17_007641 [Exophiala oligosperma]